MRLVPLGSDEPIACTWARQRIEACMPIWAFADRGRRALVVDVVGNMPGFRVLPVMCETCGRSTMVLCTVPNIAPPSDFSGAPV